MITGNSRTQCFTAGTFKKAFKIYHDKGIQSDKNVLDMVLQKKKKKRGFGRKVESL